MKILEIVANELVIAIENVLRFEEIEQFNVTLQKKIDDATKELKQSNEKLRALDEAKDEFVSMASHQLRTPLTSIKGYLSMVLDGDAGEITETQKTMLGQAFFSSQRMVYLISDLLNVSRLKTGKFVIESKPVYLPDVVGSELEQLQEGANAKNLKLTFTKPKTFAKMNLDEMKLRQVIMNFTDNAIYYTPSGGKINVELKETAKSIEFTVKDSGIGVPKEQQHKLFTKFYRADNARKARPDGTGLGLFMAKKVIIAQGGSMIFDSKEGKGSTFGFSFPKEKLEITTDVTKKITA
jgi:signal transduction histidine kinase